MLTYFFQFSVLKAFQGNPGIPVFFCIGSKNGSILIRNQKNISFRRQFVLICIDNQAYRNVNDNVSQEDGGLVDVTVLPDEGKGPASSSNILPDCRLFPFVFPSAHENFARFRW